MQKLLITFTPHLSSAKHNVNKLLEKTFAEYSTQYTTHYDSLTRKGQCPIRRDVRIVMCSMVKIEEICLQSYKLIVSMTQTKPFDKQVSSTILLLCSFRPMFLVQSTGFSSLLCQTPRHSSCNLSPLIGHGRSVLASDWSVISRGSGAANQIIY